MLRRVGLAAALAAAACCSKSEVKSTSATTDPIPARPTFTVFATAEVRGQIGPCGCTSDPLGDLSRTAQLVTQARAAGPVMFVDAGSLLYSHTPIPPPLVTQEQLKADLLAETYQKTLQADAIGLGPADLSGGPVGDSGIDHLRLPRVVANASGIPPGVNVQPAKLIEVGGAKVGVFGVIAPGAVTTIQLTDPVAAGKQAVGQLRGQGAQVVIGLVQASSKTNAIQLVRAIGGIDLTIAGLGVMAPEPERVEIEPEKVGDGWLVAPVNRGQFLTRLDVTLRGPGPLADAVGPGAAAAKLAVIDRRLAALDADLKAFAADKSADPAFVA
ncbi:MAG TPA: hypothetical protein VF469_17940, partial [Kofleriaceae bacterium]